MTSVTKGAATMETHRDDVVTPDAQTLTYQAPADDEAPFAVTLGVIGLRLLGIYLMLQPLYIVSTLASYFWGPYQRSARFSSTFAWETLVMWRLPHATFALVGIVLFWRAHPLAGRIFRGRPATPLPVNAHTVLSIAVVTVGIYLALDSLPPLLMELGSFFVRNAGPGFPRPFDTDRYPQLVTSAVRLVLGILVCIFATRIARLWSPRLP
jgi:hypothetical protein